MTDEETSKEQKEENKEENKEDKKEEKKEDIPEDKKTETPEKKGEKAKKDKPVKKEPVGLKGSLSMKIKSSTLQTIINSLNIIANEAKLNFKPQGIDTRVVDPAHVCMASLELSSMACEEYKAETFDLGIDIEKIIPILRLSKPDDIVTLEYNHGDGAGINALYIRFRNLFRRVGCLAAEGMPDAKIPTLNYAAKVVIKAEEFRLGLKSCELLSDHFAMITHPREKILEIFGEGDTDITSIKCSKENGQLTEFEAEKAKALFSLDYLMDQIKTAKSDTLLGIGFSNDSPMYLKYEFADGHGKLSYLTAPRIESE